MVKHRTLGQVTAVLGYPSDQEEPKDFTFDVPVPGGKEWRKRTGKLTKFVMTFRSKMAKLQSGQREDEIVKAGDVVNANGDEPNVDEMTPEEIERAEAQTLEILERIGELWNEDEFEGEYLPAVLGVGASHQFIQEASMMEVVQPFFDASAMIVQAGLNRPDVQAAIKKSKPDEA